MYRYTSLLFTFLADDGILDRDEFESQQTSRYGVNSSVASGMFDMADVNGNGRLSEGDWIGHFEGL